MELLHGTCVTYGVFVFWESFQSVTHLQISGYRFFTQLKFAREWVEPSGYLTHLPILYVSITHSIQPLHSPSSSFTCSEIYFSLSLPWSAHFPPSILPYLAAALRAQWQSHHTLSIRLVRPGRGAAQHSIPPVLVQSHQCQSVPLTLSVTLKRFRLPDIVCSTPPPPHPVTGQERWGRRRRWAGVKIQLSARFDATWHILWPVSDLKRAICPFNEDGFSGTQAARSLCWDNLKQLMK